MVPGRAMKAVAPNSPRETAAANPAPPRPPGPAPPRPPPPRGGGGSRNRQVDLPEDPPGRGPQHRGRLPQTGAHRPQYGGHNAHHERCGHQGVGKRHQHHRGPQVDRPVQSHQHSESHRHRRSPQWEHQHHIEPSGSAAFPGDDHRGGAQSHRHRHQGGGQGVKQGVDHRPARCNRQWSRIHQIKPSGAPGVQRPGHQHHQGNRECGKRPTDRHSHRQSLPERAGTLQVAVLRRQLQAH